MVRVFATLEFEAPATSSSTDRTSDPTQRPLLPPLRLTEGEVVQLGDFQLLLHPGSILPHSFPAGFAPLWKVPLGGDDGVDSLLVRTRQPGDHFRPVPSCHRMKLKTLMIRHKIPRSKRDTWPVVVTEDDRLVWVPALPVARDFAAPPGAAPRAWLLAGEIAK